MNTITTINLLVIVLSSVWVFFDAKQIGVEKLKAEKLASEGPSIWCFSCLMLWIIIFPSYLLRRIRYKRLAGKNESSVVATIIGFGLIAVPILSTVLSLTGDIKMPTAELQEQVRHSIEQTWAKEPNVAKNVRIESFLLIHKSGNEYEGLLEANADGKTEKAFIDVTYDGKTFIWKLRR